MSAEMEFEIEQIEERAQPYTLTDLRRDIEAVVNYNWSDEYADYEQVPCDGHVFETLVRLNRFVEER